MAKISINISTGSLQEEEMIVGIDLGTTNSLIAIVHPESRQPVVLKEVDQTTLVPSIVYFDEQDQPLVGNEAIPHLVDAPERTIFSVKRLMGKTYQDVHVPGNFFSYRVIDDGTENLVKIQVGERFYSPIELSSFILASLKKRAEHILKTPVTKAVITVPAYFNDAQRQATRDAGRLAGLDVLRIINEPTTASLAYGIGLNKEDDTTVAVYDLGGGTFDISILRISNGIVEVLSTNGDTFLGGDDVDRAIMDYWMAQNGSRSEQAAADRSYLQRLRLMAEAAKKSLGTDGAFQDAIEDDVFDLSQEEFHELLLPLINRTLDKCRSALKDAELTVKDIREVLMVGGSTRMPFLAEKVGEFFGRPVNNSLNPDEVVALGAAIQADILSGKNTEMLLLDITSLSLGVETMGGLMDVLLPRNTRIPAKATRQYTTQKDGQSGMKISVYQGERDLVQDNRKLGAFDLKGIPAMPAGLPKVEIGFLINADGILSVSATELRSGVAQSIEIKPQLGLTDEEVERMLLDSIQHAQSDIQTRALIEAQTEGRVMLDTTENFLQKNGALLSAEEHAQTQEAMQQLRSKIESGSKDEVQQAVEKLNEISRPYAERVMDEAVGRALKGRKLDGEA